MQTTNICGHEITRLILGDNPFNGYTYIADDLPADELPMNCWTITPRRI